MSNYFEKSNQIIEGLHKSFESADCKMANRVCYGYNALPNGELVINKDEAKVVYWIFSHYLAGDSLGKIAANLEKQDILSPTGKTQWNRETISKLLSNEKYVGSVLLQKTVSYYGTQFKNDGKQQQILIKNHHKAIITIQDFKNVQEMKNARSKNQEQAIGLKMSY